MSISIQTDDFDVASELAQLRGIDKSAGAIVTFIGLVRDMNEGDNVAAMHLEHYPGMTEKALERIVTAARSRWDVQAVRVIHRVGDLLPSDQIVFVGVSSVHRQEAFAACQFIMDYLKTEAPFWKHEATSEGERWVEARETDLEAARRWA